MQCINCSGKLKKQKIDIVRYWGDQLIALNNVPALVCQKFGERYFEPKVRERMDERIKQILDRKTSTPSINVPVVQF